MSKFQPRKSLAAVAAVFIAFILNNINVSSCLTAIDSNLENVCHCITHGGTRGNEWGALSVSSNQVRTNGTDCLVVYIRAAPDELIELRFYEIILRAGCLDSIQIHPHLRDSIVTETARNDDTICAENAVKYIANRHPNAIDQHWADINSIDGPQPPAQPEVGNRSADDDDGDKSRVLHSANDNQPQLIATMNKQSIYSSTNVMGIHLKYGHIGDVRVENFRATADFRFLKKSHFEVEGNLVPTTLCDYQFLPYPINVALDDVAANNGVASWRRFFSPRYPSRYAAHTKCAYKFIGRPLSVVEVVFEDIDLPPADATNHRSKSSSSFCTSLADRLTVYDSRTPDKTTIIDVLCCSRTTHKKIVSSGPSLLIEFETSSNRTAMGFSAKYRFSEWPGSNINSDHITATATENLVVSHPSPVISFNAVANPAVKPHQTHSLLKTNSTTSIHPILLPDIPRATSNHDTKHLPVESVTDEGTNDISTAIQNYNVTASTCPPAIFVN